MTVAVEPMYSAVIHAADGVRLTISARSEEERRDRVVGYIAERYEFTLWPDAADSVGRLLAAGRLADAIAAYFESVGERWDEERLDLL